MITVDVRASLRAPRLIPRGPEVNNWVNLQWPWGDSNWWPLGSKPKVWPTELLLRVKHDFILFFGLECYSRLACLIYNGNICRLFIIVIMVFTNFLVKFQIEKYNFVNITMSMIKWWLKKIPFNGWDLKDVFFFNMKLRWVVSFKE